MSLQYQKVVIVTVLAKLSHLDKVPRPYHDGTPPFRNALRHDGTGSSPFLCLRARFSFCVGAIPKELGALHMLEKLILSDNKLAGERAPNELLQHSHVVACVKLTRWRDATAM